MPKAWEVLEQKEWCKKAFARDKQGQTLQLFEPSNHLRNDVDPYAVCALGAIVLAYDERNLLNMLDNAPYKKLEAYLGFHVYPGNWNDRQASKEDVIKVLKELDI